MKKRFSVTQLAELSERNIEETLFNLYENKIDTTFNPNALLSGRKLKEAFKCLNIPTAKQLKSIAFWEKRFNLDHVSFLRLLEKYNIIVKEGMKSLPKGSVKVIKKIAKQLNLATIKKEEQKEAPNVTPLVWKNIGHSKNVHTLSFDDILKIHYALAADFEKRGNPIDPAGPRENGLLESAVFRQHASFQDYRKYSTVEMTGAALIHSLIHNHPFHNGNKRTALVALLVFLDKNKLVLTCSHDDLFDFIVLVANHAIIDRNIRDSISDREVLKIAEWIHVHARIIELGDRPLKCRKFKQILNNYGCSFEISHSTLKISREIKESRWFKKQGGNLKSAISYGGDGREVLPHDINKVRKDLHLDELNGIDSASFYDNAPTSPDELITEYRKILLRLAEI